MQTDYGTYCDLGLFNTKLALTFKTLFKRSPTVNQTPTTSSAECGAHFRPKVTEEHRHITHRDGLCFMKTKK